MISTVGAGNNFRDECVVLSKVMYLEEQKRQHSVHQLPLVGTQRTNVERYQSAADTENLWGASAGVLRQGAYRGYSTVTEWFR